MDKQKALDNIAKEIEACKICKKDKTGVAVPGEGNPNADVVFIGEAPGKTEAQTGRPFIGRSGQLLRSLIREIGLKEEDVYITSPVKYLPRRGTPTSEDIAHGRIHLMQQFAVIQPKLVVLLGRVAAEGVLERKVLVAKEHGAIIEDPISHFASLKLRGARREGVRYFLTYHPAAALRFVKFKKVLVEDFLRLQKIL